MKPILCLLLMVALFFSCEKEHAIDKTRLFWGQKEIEHVGISHNAIVTEVILEERKIRSLDEIPMHVKLRVPGLEMEANTIAMSEQDLKDFAQGRVENVLSRFSEHESYQWVRKILWIDFDKLTLQEATAKLHQIEKGARASIVDSKELTSVLVALNVAENSAALWLPKSQGGLELTKHIAKIEGLNFTELRDDGFYGDAPSEEEDPGYKSDPSKKKTKIIVASDAVGAYTGFLQTAVLAPIPGVNSAVAVNTVLQGATASVLAAISLW